ncbi:MAG: AraC family transcriptional regulator [Devosia sp.]|nr:AraC family transcriptional regulator [Devosia sp.]
MGVGMVEVFQKPADDYEPRGRLDPAGFERHVEFITRLPPGDLAPFIEHFWIVRWDAPLDPYGSEEVMHRPYVDVFVSADEAGIQGTFRGRRTYLAKGQGRIVGARFRPGAFHAFWGGGALSDLQEKIVDLQQVFAEADAGYVARVSGLHDQAAMDALVELVRSKQPQADANIELVNQIIAAIETDEALTTVAAVAEAFGKSERWVQQLFRDYLGIGLKWLLQRNRLLAAAALIQDSDKPDWIGIAYDLGYSSQAHFNSDFKAVMGRTPTQYKRWTIGF